MPDDPQAVLRTDRLVLVPLAEHHLTEEIALDADPEVMRYLGNGRARDRAHVETLHRGRLAAAALVPGLGFWAGTVRGEFVGWWLLEPVGDPVGRCAELGYRLHRRWWRRGLASEGARELVRHAFDDLRLDRIVARTMAVNTASRATMATVGLGYVRTFHEQWDEPIDGAEHGEVEYTLTRTEWLARR